MSVRRTPREIFDGLRHPIAAIAGVAGLVLVPIAVVGGSASAADGDITGVTTFNCTVGTFAPYDYAATITVKASRETATSTKVSLSATISEMPGVVPVTLGDTAVTDELKLNLGGTAVTLKGTGTTKIEAKKPLVMPAMKGTMTTSASSLSTAVTGFNFAMPAFAMSGVCTPTSGADLGTLTILSGGSSSSTATATSTPTSTDSATATPTESTSATASPSASTTDAPEASPAKGDVAFSCVLEPLMSEFDYDATITVNGYREEEGGDVILSAKMSDIPGISPVQIDGDMEVELDVTVGGEAVTLKGSSTVSAPPKQKVPVPKLSGTVAADGDEMEVVVSAFMFEIVTAGLTVTAPCEADDVALGRMVIGTEAPDETDDPDPTTSPTTTATTPVSSGSGSLPKTGGGDALPVVVLWAGALTLLGVAGLLVVPSAVRRRTH